MLIQLLWSFVKLDRWIEETNRPEGIILEMSLCDEDHLYFMAHPWNTIMVIDADENIVFEFPKEDVFVN